MRKKLNSSTFSWTIVLLSIVGLIYLNLQNTRLRNEITSLNEEIISSNHRVEYDQKFTQLDSLLLLDNYQKATTLIHEMNLDSNLTQNSKFIIRQKLLDEISILKKQKKRAYKPFISSAQKNAIRNTSISENSNDSLLVALKTSSIEISQLKNELKNNSKNSPQQHLEFKTSKGTPLYYIGDIKKGKANGHGVAVLESGSRYEGQWKSNLRHGKGHFFWNDGQHYKGEYLDDKRHGFGIYYWENGDRYEGQWKDDKRNGKGKFYNSKGKLKTSGIWENDKLKTKEK